jgi:hypothetical protein
MNIDQSLNVIQDTKRIAKLMVRAGVCNKCAHDVVIWCLEILKENDQKEGPPLRFGHFNCHQAFNQLMCDDVSDHDPVMLAAARIPRAAASRRWTNARETDR